MLPVLRSATAPLIPSLPSEPPRGPLEVRGARSRTWGWLGASAAAGLAIALASACGPSGAAPAAETAAAAAAAATPAPAAGEAAAPDLAAATLPAAEELLDKAVAASGGRDKLAAIRSFHMVGRTEIAGQNLGGRVEMWWRDGDYYTEQEMVGVGLIKAGRSGDVAWSQDPILGLRRLAGIEAEQTAWASALSLPLSWRDHFTSAQTTASRSGDGGRQLYDITLTSPSGDKVIVTLDATTHQVLGQSFQQQSPMGATPVQITLGDYRDVDGIQIAFSAKVNASLVEAANVTEKLELNVEVDPAKFGMPTNGALAIPVVPPTVAPGGAVPAAPTTPPAAPAAP